MVQRLDPARVADTVATLHGWTVTNDGRAIVRSFAFGDFVEAFGFMARVAIHAERANHHPEWSNIYNRVEIRLTTHDCEGISQRDIHLARQVDKIAGRPSVEADTNGFDDARKTASKVRQPNKR